MKERRKEEGRREEARREGEKGGREENAAPAVGNKTLFPERQHFQCRTSSIKEAPGGRLSRRGKASSFSGFLSGNENIF